MTNDVHTCVTYGLFRCARAYAWAALVNGPSRCQKLSVGTLLGVGIWSCCFPAPVPLVEVLFVECARRWRNFWRMSMWRRSTVRHAEQAAIPVLLDILPVVKLARRRHTNA